MIRCGNCGTDNLDGSEYCDECGMKLELGPLGMSCAEPPAYQPPLAGNSPAAPRNGDARNAGMISPRGGLERQGQSKPSAGPDPQVPLPPSFTTSTSIPKPARPMRDYSPQTSPGDRAALRVPPEAAGPGQTLVLSSRGRTDALRSDQAQVAPGSLRISSKLVIERGGRIGREFPITGVETHIGRWDADSGIFPDVDLDQDDPEAKVSRRHARIVNQSGQYFIEDLGSTNGTFVNRGRRLLPGHRHLLQNGDEIIVGKTFLKFHILS